MNIYLERAYATLRKGLMFFMPEEQKNKLRSRIRKTAFKKNFDEKLAAGLNCSGGGSTIEYTAVTREIIKEVIQRYEIKSMADLPCGDFEWMPLVIKDLPADFSYFGGDIVPDLIKRNSARHPECTFQVIDFVEDELPVVDMIFSRDALQHLPIPDIKKALENFSRSGARYLLTTTYLRRYGWRNARDIRPSRCNDRNLILPPFNLAAPIVIYGEQDPINKYLGLWKLPLNYIGSN